MLSEKSDVFEKKICAHLCFPSRICLITIAPSHKLLQDGDIANISFQSNRGKNRTENKVSGKGKKGGQQLEHNSMLCEVVCSNGNKYNVRRFVFYFC